MKTIVVLSAFLGLSFSASADWTVVDGGAYTCAELRQLVADAGGPVPIQGRFGYAVYAANGAACGGLSVGGGTVFGTADQNFCNVGVSCYDNSGGGGGGN